MKIKEGNIVEGMTNLLVYKEVAFIYIKVNF